MRHTSTFLAGCFALCVLLVIPARASADVFLTPFVGTTFIDNEQRKGTFGAGVGVGSLVSVEFESARTLLGSVAGVPVVDLNAHATTIMGNVMLRAPGPIQPYASVGAGIVRVTGSVDVPFLGSAFSASADDFGWNFGGGVMFFPGTNVGIRADIRRFQTGQLSWDEIAGIGGLGDVPLPKVDFWRATGGVTFRF